MAHALPLLELPHELLACALLCDDPRADAQAVGRLASSSKALQQRCSIDAVIDGLQAARKMLTNLRQHELKVAAGSDAAFQFDPSDYKQLAQQLPAPETTLDLGGKLSEWPAAPCQRVWVVARLLRVSNSLTTLDIGGNDIGDEGAKAIADAVAASGSLAHLDIGYNDIGDEGAKAIANAVAASGSLAMLWLIGNKIGDQGAKALAAAVATSGSLASLNIGFNNIGNEGAKALAAGVAASGSLATLDMSHNKIGDKGAKAIAEAIRASGSLALKRLVVPYGLEKHAELMAACKSKGVELEY